MVFNLGDYHGVIRDHILVDARKTINGEEKPLDVLPLKYRLLAKTILFLCGFEIYRQRFGDAGFWLITNKPLPKEIHDEDVVFENKSAQTGQIRKAKLACDGEEGRVKCRWVFDIQK